MKAVLQGSCLSGGHGKVEVSTSDRFKLLHHADSQPPTSIRLAIDNIKVEDHLVSIGQKPSIYVIEHLFSSLYGLNLFNVQIDVFGNELPFFDGSSKEYTEKLKGMSTTEKPHGFSADRKVVVSHESSYIMYEPLKKDILIIDMELFHPFIGKQQIGLEINEKTFIEEIAPARTFVFTEESDPRLKDLPPYGIGVTKDNIYSTEPLRYKDELIRHKILDLLGDLYILQKRLAGKISSRNTSHLLNLKFTRKLMDRLLHKHSNS